MKHLASFSSIIFISLSSLFAQQNSIQIQANKTNSDIPPSDQQAVAYDERAYLNETIAIFRDAIEYKRNDNAYVLPYMEKPGFPKKKDDSSIGLKKFTSELELWIKNNPELMKQLYADREKAHKRYIKQQHD